MIPSCSSVVSLMCECNALVDQRWSMGSTDKSGCLAYGVLASRHRLGSRGKGCQRRLKVDPGSPVEK